MKTVLIFAFLLGGASSAFGVVGGVNEPGKVPAELCQIMEISNKGRVMAEKSCSALAINKTQLMTAGHCGLTAPQQMYVDCASGDQFAVMAKWEYVDPLGALSPHAKVSNIQRLGEDQAILTISRKLSVKGLSFMTSGVQEQVESGKCYFVATGTDETGSWGKAQAKRVGSGQWDSVLNNVLRMTGLPYIAGHDSGGALVCSGKIAGTLVGQRDRKSYIALINPESSLGDIVNLSEAQTGLEPCDAGRTSKAVKDSLAHVMGFHEVRAFLDKRAKQGLHYCAEGIALNKNIYQYYKNLLIIKVMDQSDRVVDQMNLLFQTSSVQGHHSTMKRPWITLDTKESMQVFAKVLGETYSQAPLFKLASPKPTATRPSLNLEGALNLLAGKKLQGSSVLVQTGDSVDRYLVGWLEQVSGGGSNVFVNLFGPKYAIVELDLKTKKQKVVSQGLAFGDILVPLEELLEKYQQKTLPMDEAEMAEAIEEYVD